MSKLAAAVSLIQSPTLSLIFNQKVLSDKPNKTNIDNCNCHNKDTFSLPSSCLMKNNILNLH